MVEENHTLSDENPAIEVEHAQELAKALTTDEIKSGGWFLPLLTKVIHAYNRNARADYFQLKYPGLPADMIADKLISVASRYAAITGGVTGAVSSINLLALPPAILGEIIGITAIQIRLVLDLSIIYDLQLNSDDPEDMLMIFGYALGVAPTDLIGKGLQTAGGAATKQAVKSYINKETLEAVQAIGRAVGIKILQRDIIKFAVPVISVAIGSSFNYMMTTSVGNIAKAHFKNRGKVTEELRGLISRQNRYSLVFPAALLYMAKVDGKFGPQEHELYQAMLSRMTFNEYTLADYQRLTANEDRILEAIAQLNDPTLVRTFMDTVILMAVYDGELAEQESAFLQKIADQLQLEINLDEIEQRTLEFRKTVKENYLQKSTTATKTFLTNVKGAVKGRVKGQG
jgi:uncharacterized protein (DUF697 family)